MSSRLFRSLLFLAAAAALSAVALRLAPVSAESRAANRERILDSIATGLEDDSERMARALSKLGKSRRFVEIIEGGGSELRPSQLFSVLEEGLPAGNGWGGVFLDPAGRPVAWAGEVPSLEAAWRLEPAGTLFSSTRFTVYRTETYQSGTEARGTLLISRTYPTGLLRPGLQEFFNWPLVTSRLRIRAREAASSAALVRLFLEPIEESEEAEEIGRKRALAAVLVASLALLAALPASRSPGLLLLTLRLILLLGSPVTRSGVFQDIFRESPGPLLVTLLVGTPWDALATGLVSLLAVVSFSRGFSGSRSARRGLVWLGIPVALLFSALPAAAAFWLTVPPSDLAMGLNLVPLSTPHFLVRSGLVLLGCAASLGAATVLASLSRQVRAVWLVLFLAGGGAGVVARGGSWAFCALAAVTAALILAFGRSKPLPQGSAPTLSRLLEVGAILAATTLLIAAGSALGRQQRVEAVLAQVERELEPDTGLARTSQLQDSVACEPCEPWLPAGERTQTEDLARSLWVRGLERRPGNFEDVLTVRDMAGRVVSSFGRLRPGTERRAQVIPIELPLRGFTATLMRLHDPRANERDPLLTAVLARERPRDVPVERIDYDAAGRPAGQGESGDLAAPLLSEARRWGIARGYTRRSGETQRILVRRLPFGFAGYSAPAATPGASLGSALAAALAASPLWFFPVLAASFRQKAAKGSWKRLRFSLGGPGSFQQRLITLLLLSGAVPVFGGAVAMRFALERQTEAEASRKALTLLEEARRALDVSAVAIPSSADLNRVSAFLGADLMLYQEGRIVAASRALPVTAGLASRQLSPRVAAGLAEGRPESVAPARQRAGDLEVVEAALLLARPTLTALVTVAPIDVSTRETFDALILAAFLIALAALGLGGRSALSLSSSVESLVEAAERLGDGFQPASLARADIRELARLSEAFSAMAQKIQERTELLARERESAVTLLSRLTAAVLLFRRSDGAVVFANPQADESFPGSDLKERLSSERWTELRAFLRSESKTGGARIGRVKENGGEGRLFRAVLVPLPPDELEPRAVLILEDLTDLLRAERLAAWVDAARAVAHDIKNPLTPIRLAAERLLRHASRLPSDVAPVLESAVDVILRQASILTERIGRLGRLSDPRSAEVQPIEPGALATLLSEVTADYRITGRDISLVLSDDLPELLTDGGLVRDAVANFIQNSIEALGEVPGRITLSVARSRLRSGKPAIAVACEDDGPGVKPEDMGRLFEPGFSTKSRGSGMGLFATRRAVESLGGEVFAETRVPSGLRIGFRLPAVDMIFEGPSR
ncbi:MAG: hypothetical protein IT186_26955 [Acidobacteria bacterium]|nr:hypothetical protein [Acidobacteriota bacterium]